MAATDTSVDGIETFDELAELRKASGDEPDQGSIEHLWQRYRTTHDEAIRNHLIERFLPLVRYNAERIYSRLPDEVDLDDLMSAGLFGLMDAINAYDPERKVKFETFSAPRIKGAILDELRAMDWAPRLVRSRSAKVEYARQQIEMDRGRPATEVEIAEYLGLEDEEFQKFKRDSAVVTTISITRRAGTNDDSREMREMEIVREETDGNPVRHVQRRDVKDLINKGLTRAERLIVILYYYEGMTMKEIGATLNLSESRVSQMHSSILLRLKAQLQHRSIELEPVE